MSDDVELYKDGEIECGIEVWPDAFDMFILNGDDYAEIPAITPDRARQIGLRLIKWADEQETPT